VLVKKYRPKTLKEVYGLKRIKQAIQKWVDRKDIPHLLFVGPNGNGKTMMAEVICNEMGVQSRDVLFINASEERGIDVVREKIINFAKTMKSLESPFKVVILDEGDALTKQAQRALRRTIEQYAEYVRFIITGNDIKGISTAIQDRCTGMRFRGIHYSHIESLIKDVAMKEGYVIYDDVAKAIREQAHGSARQALMLLEFVMSIDDPTPEDVVQLTGRPKDAVVWEIIYGALKGKMSALERYDQLIRQGTDPMQVLMMMYYGAVRGSLRNVSDGQRLRIVRAIGSVPMATAEQNTAAAIAKLIDLSARKEQKASG